MGNKGVAVLIHDFNIRLVGGVVRTTPGRFTLRTELTPMAREAGWASLWIWVCAEILEYIRIRTPNLQELVSRYTKYANQAPSKSLYQVC